MPLRIEIGPKDVAKNAVVFARRDKPGREGKTFGIPVAEVGTAAQAMLDEIQANMLARATAFRDSNIIDVTTMEQFNAVVSNNQWARVWWAGTSEQETQIKNETGATLRCIPLDQPGGTGVCVLTGQAATEIALFAKAY